MSLESRRRCRRHAGGGPRASGGTRHAGRRRRGGSRIFLLAAILAAGASWPAVAAKDDLTLVSRASGSLGPGGDLASFAPAISADGRFVAFESFARNFSTADDDAVSDVFVRDTATGATTLVSRAPGVGGLGGDGFSAAPAISPDGRFVAFESTADNLSTADGPATDVFLRHTATGATTLVSRASGSLGSAGDGPSFSATISADGRFVAFSSSADNLSAVDDDTVTDIFLRDTATSATTLVSRGPGAGGPGGDGGSAAPAISADGRFVAFSSSADNLSTEDDDGAGGVDIFVRDTATGATTLASRAQGASGPGGDGPSEVSAISGDGRFVAFESDADNLSAEDDDTLTNVFLRDTATGATTLVSRAQGASGFRGDRSSTAPAISHEGRFVAFQSDAANLSAEDGDAFTDVFLRDVLGPPLPPEPPVDGGTTVIDPLPPPLTLSRASLSGRYTARGLRAKLILRGASSSGGTFPVRLRRTRGPRTVGLVTSASLRLRLTKAGPFVARLRLPRRLAPGRYALTAGGVAVPGRQGILTIARPRLGLIHRAFASGLRGGAPALVVPRRTRIVFCSFRFAILPVDGKITTEWRQPPPRGLTERTLRPRAFRVSGFVRGNLGEFLDPGRYTCTLRVRAQKLASASIRVR
jgi:Tol biopolymer transport system component